VRQLASQIEDEMTMAKPNAGFAAYPKSQELHAKFGKRLLRYLKFSTGDDEVAEDISQKLWVRVLEHEGPFEDSGQGESWLFTIARHLVIDFRRKRKRKPTESLDDLYKRDRRILGNGRGAGEDGEDENDSPGFEPRDHCPTPEAWLSTVEEDEKVEAVLSQIEPLYCAVLKPWLHGSTIGEIAEKTSTPVSAVKARFYRGKSKLLEAMQIELEAKW
jgi:RNA polymerase sigma-70 factor (ECF subfamily)